ncbi:MAG TPA: TIGR01777 family oxidoreductase, partial [Bacteroidota bacterium]|nr:TIGR01777 family oxidoreductase [Bacteroidota bacterium]
MKVIIAGGSGFVARGIVEQLARESHEIVLLTRRTAHSVPVWQGVRAVQWDARSVGGWSAELEKSDVVMNFAGEPLDAKRWTSHQKNVIIASRVDATRALVDAIRRASNKPSVLINASAVGYYGAVEHEDVTEDRGAGSDFLARVVEAWEKEAKAAEQLGVRVVLLRMGVVLARDGGALRKMALPFKFYLGGYLGSGRQWFPWVHRDDVANVVKFALQHAALSGPVNVVAPEPVTMKQFCAALGKAMRRPSWAPVPSVMLKLALGEMADMLLTGQRVVPAKLLKHNYNFLYPGLDAALRSIF